MGTPLVTAILLSCLVVLMLSYTAAPLGLHTTLSNADALVTSGDVKMSLRDLVEARERARLNMVERYLYDHGLQVLWGLTYVLAGAAGGLIWVWLVLARAVKPPSPLTAVVVFARLVVGAAAGFIMYFFAAAGLGVAGIVANSEGVTLSPQGGGAVMALCAGIFSPVFFVKLENHWLRNLKLSGGRNG